MRNFMFLMKLVSDNGCKVDQGKRMNKKSGIKSYLTSYSTIVLLHFMNIIMYIYPY